MNAPRFLLEEGLDAGGTVPLPETVAHHALRVLRLRPGDAIVLFDGRGHEYAAVLESAPGRAGAAQGRILGGGALSREPALHLTLVQALCAQDKTDWLLEKAVELGAARVLLGASRRSVVRLDGPRRERRAARLREIAASACCQCGRNTLPKLAILEDFEGALRAGAAQTQLRLLLDPRAASGLPRALLGAGAVALAVGPEGGFAPEESECARALGYSGVRLGARILRTETAGLAAMAALLGAHGEYD